MSQKKDALAILTTARNLITGRGKWIKGEYSDDRRYGVCYCAMGALQQASADVFPYDHKVHLTSAWDRGMKARERATKALGDLLRADGFKLDDEEFDNAYDDSMVIEYNDMKKTKKNDVLALFDRAIEKLS